MAGRVLHSLVRARDMRDVGRMSRMSSKHTLIFLFISKWDVRTSRRESMIDLMERAGIAMSVRGQFTDPIADPKVTLGALAFANDSQ